MSKKKDWRKIDVETVADMVSKELFGGTSSFGTRREGINYWDFRLVTWAEVDATMGRIMKRGVAE